VNLDVLAHVSSRYSSTTSIVSVAIFTVPLKELFSHFHVMNVLALIAELQQDEGRLVGKSDGIAGEPVWAAAEVHFGVSSILALRKRPTVLVSTTAVLVIPLDPSYCETCVIQRAWTFSVWSILPPRHKSKVCDWGLTGDKWNNDIEWSGHVKIRFKTELPWNISVNRKLNDIAHFQSFV